MPSQSERQYERGMQEGLDLRDQLREQIADRDQDLKILGREITQLRDEIERIKGVPYCELLSQAIREGTHGDPPDRRCLPGSDDKWIGYQLAIEDAIAVVAEFFDGPPAEKPRAGVWTPND